MDYKYHLEKILDKDQSVQSQLDAMRAARKELFLEKNQKTMNHLQETAHEYEGMSKICCLKKIREEYGFHLSEALAIVDKLEWYK